MTKKDKKLASISARIPKEMLEDLKLLCITLSKVKGTVFTLSELIRETLLPLCPADKRKGYFE